MSSFSALQAALKAGSGERLRLLRVRPAASRRPRSQAACRSSSARRSWRNSSAATATRRIRFSEHFRERRRAHAGDSACGMGLEGIVSKQLDEPYRSGRSEAFVKVKCSNAQELVVGGYAPSNVMPNAIGALVVGYYDGGKLHYAGRVGTGYTQAVAKDLWKRLHPLEIAKPPFDDIPREERRARALGQADDGDRSQSRAAGRRTTWCARRRSRACARTSRPRRSCARYRSWRKMQLRETKQSGAAKSGGAAAKDGRRRAAKSTARPQRSRSTKPPTSEVRFTHPDRVYWADVGVTKQDLADYYRAGLGLDGAAGRGPPAQPPALSGRHGGRVLLPEARLRRIDRGETAHRRSTASAGRSSRSRISTVCCRWCRRACSKCMCAAR